MKVQGVTPLDPRGDCYTSDWLRKHRSGFQVPCWLKGREGMESNQQQKMAPARNGFHWKDFMKAVASFFTGKMTWELLNIWMVRCEDIVTLGCSPSIRRASFLFGNSQKPSLATVSVGASHIITGIRVSSDLITYLKQKKLRIKGVMYPFWFHFWAQAFQILCPSFLPAPHASNVAAAMVDLPHALAI